MKSGSSLGVIGGRTCKDCGDKRRIHGCCITGVFEEAHELHLGLGRVYRVGGIYRWIERIYGSTGRKLGDTSDLFSGESLVPYDCSGCEESYSGFGQRIGTGFYVVHGESFLEIGEIRYTHAIACV